MQDEHVVSGIVTKKFPLERYRLSLSYGGEEIINSPTGCIEVETQAGSVVVTVSVADYYRARVGERLTVETITDEELGWSCLIAIGATVATVVIAVVVVIELTAAL